MDLGCGRGHVGLALERLNLADKVQELVQVDVAKEITDSARQRCRSCGSKYDVFQVTDEEDIPFASNSFDIVISSLALHWVNDLPGAMVQINNILKPDGLFIGAMLGGERTAELSAPQAQSESGRGHV